MKGRSKGKKKRRRGLISSSPGAGSSQMDCQRGTPGRPDSPTERVAWSKTSEKCPGLSGALLCPGSVRLSTSGPALPSGIPPSPGKGRCAPRSPDTVLGELRHCASGKPHRGVRQAPTSVGETPTLSPEISLEPVSVVFEPRDKVPLERVMTTTLAPWEIRGQASKTVENRASGFSQTGGTIAALRDAREAAGRTYMPALM